MRPRSGSIWSPPGARPPCSLRPSRPHSRTRLADAYTGVSDETWDRARKHYDDDQLAALVCLVAQINAANRLAVLVHQQGGSYEVGMFAGLAT